jgi:hypothetical protein
MILLQNTLVDDASTRGDFFSSFLTELLPTQDSSFSWSNLDASNIRVLVVLQIQSHSRVKRRRQREEEECITWRINGENTLSLFSSGNNGIVLPLRAFRRGITDDDVESHYWMILPVGSITQDIYGGKRLRIHCLWLIKPSHAGRRSRSLDDADERYKVSCIDGSHGSSNLKPSRFNCITEEAERIWQK